MEKKALLTYIHDIYRQSVVNPVNPFTVDNPDILLFNGKSLIGLYFPLSKEIKNSDLLLRRLCLSRLSLSKTLTSILVIHNESISLLNNEQIQMAFDFWYVYESDRDLIRFLNEVREPRETINHQLRMKRMQRFWGTMEYLERYGMRSDRYEPFEDIDNNIHFRTKSWSEPGKWKSLKCITYSHPFLITSKGRSKQPFMERFEDLMTVITMFNYTLSSGTLKDNPEALDTFMFLNLYGIESIKNNPMNVRTLAFLGFIPGSVSSNFNIDEMRDKYYSFLSRRHFL